MIKAIISGCAVLTLSALAVTHAEFSYEQELQQGCNKVKQYASLGKKFYDQKQYKKALENFQNQASWTAFCKANADETTVKFTDRDIEVANNNVGLAYAKLGQPIWARAWFMLDEKSKSSQFNLKQLPQPKASNDLSGEYVRYSGFGEWDHITVSRKQGQYTIGYSGVYMGLRSLIYGPNMGEFGTTMPTNAKQTIYKDQDCRIQLDFKSNAKLGNYIQVKQSEGESGCGFGHNVYADGTYLKVESGK